MVTTITKSPGQDVQTGGAVFNAAPPTLVNGEESPLLCDNVGNLLVSSTSSPGSPVFVKDAQLTPLGFFTTTVDGTTAKNLNTIAGGLIPVGALYATVQVATDATSVTCNYRSDGVNPTAALGGGTQLLKGVILFVELVNLGSNFTIIGTAAGPSTILVEFFK